MASRTFADTSIPSPYPRYRSAIDRTIEFDEDFRAPELDPARWVAHYLPHWTTPDRSAARYELRRGLLTLRIDADQPAWLPEDGAMRVSNLQTGAREGQHRHREGLAVRTPYPERRLFLPAAGRVEAEMRASADPTCMAAFWLVGFEAESPQDSGEICVCELYGRSRSTVRTGVKAHHDPRLRDEMEDVELDVDTAAWHTYAAEWDGAAVAVLVDGTVVKTVRQRIAYPLQLMVDLFEFPGDGPRDPAAYPKVAEVRAVRGYGGAHG